MYFEKAGFSISSHVIVYACIKREVINIIMIFLFLIIRIFNKQANLMVC